MNIIADTSKGITHPTNLLANVGTAVADDTVIDDRDALGICLWFEDEEYTALTWLLLEGSADSEHARTRIWELQALAGAGNDNEQLLRELERWVSFKEQQG